MPRLENASVLDMMKEKNGESLTTHSQQHNIVRFFGSLELDFLGSHPS
jgi:hypothetical protein